MMKQLAGISIALTAVALPTTALAEGPKTAPINYGHCVSQGRLADAKHAPGQSGVGPLTLIIDLASGDAVKVPQGAVNSPQFPLGRVACGPDTSPD